MMTRDNWNVKYILYYKLKYIILLFDMYYIKLKLYYIESIKKISLSLLLICGLNMEIYEQ